MATVEDNSILSYCSSVKVFAGKVRKTGFFAKSVYEFCGLSDNPARQHALGNLHHVGSRALAQVIGHYPQV